MAHIVLKPNCIIFIISFTQLAARLSTNLKFGDKWGNLLIKMSKQTTFEEGEELTTNAGSSIAELAHFNRGRLQVYHLPFPRSLLPY
jgi:hypothetical protein